MEWWQLYGLEPEISKLIIETEKAVKKEHDAIDTISLFNQAKVLSAFREEKISEDCFFSNEGYGYNDLGREKLEALFTLIFKGEDALVRPHLVSGTHTLFTCLRGLLRPGERLLVVTGQPYDTLWRAIGGRQPAREGRQSEPVANGDGNLADLGVSFSCLDIMEKEGETGNNADEKLKRLLGRPTSTVLIQRSRGYNPFRRSLTIDDIAGMIDKIRSYRPDVAIFVDNCYGEFVEKEEPLEAGADLLAGSLIKNPGGGLAPTGGYIVGKKEYVRRVSNALTAPGLAKKLGAFVSGKRLYFQGLFMAPHLTGEALKGAVTLAGVLEKAGYDVNPRPGDKRGDIVQMIRLKKKEELQNFCRAVQQFSPINSHFVPVEGETPGYRDPIFMAAGTFVQGATSEFTADAPLRRPYTLYLQGGLSYQHVILVIASILKAILP
ncbi:MAG TPA: hypothetical protein GXZ24_07765 [Firmicutes bacterium]|jgi:cystathionine beta-lyase family protein involved in aluminum resistance|nr:hypothetical protein [Bacillota bacterium]